MKTTKSGFSLIELLTTISLVIILVTFILPGLNSVRKQSRSAVCKYNLQQMGILLAIYRNEYDSELPYELPWPWPEILEQNNYLGQLRRPIRESYYETIFDCPSRVNDGAIQFAEYSLNSNIHGAVPAGTELPHPGGLVSVGDGAYSKMLPNYMGVFPVDFRHYGRANILFFDGHVEERIDIGFGEIVPEGLSLHNTAAGP